MQHISCIRTVHLWHVPNGVDTNSKSWLHTIWLRSRQQKSEHLLFIYLCFEIPTKKTALIRIMWCSVELTKVVTCKKRIDFFFAVYQLLFNIIEKSSTSNTKSSSNKIMELMFTSKYWHLLIWNVFWKSTCDCVTMPGSQNLTSE